MYKRQHFLFVELLHAQDARRFVVVVEVKVGGVEIPVFEHNEHEVVRMKFSEILAALVIVEALHVGVKPQDVYKRQAYKDTTQYKQLFYMMPGSDDMHFRLYTYQGEPVDYVKGKAGSSWNKGNPSPIVEMPFLQYATEKAGEFQVIMTGTEGYYSFASDGILMNDRGTGNGAAANMKLSLIHI